MDRLKENIDSGAYRKLSLEDLEQWNQKLYEDILPEHYETSYANPAYAQEKLGEEYGQILSFLVYGTSRGNRLGV